MYLIARELDNCVIKQFEHFEEAWDYIKRCAETNPYFYLKMFERLDIISTRDIINKNELLENLERQHFNK